MKKDVKEMTLDDIYEEYGKLSFQLKFISRRLQELDNIIINASQRTFPIEKLNEKTEIENAVSSDTKTPKSKNK